MAQSSSYFRFEHLTVEDGLSQSVVRTMLHDRDGFMWFGTDDGLNRYDGYRFTVFRNQPGNPKSLSDNSISALAEDAKGRIWVGTAGGGMNRYDPETRTMVRLPEILSASLTANGRMINALCFDRKGILWIGTDGEGLFAYNPVDSSLSVYRADPADESKLSGNEINDIRIADSSHLWIGGSGACVNLFDIESGSVVRYRHQPSGFAERSVDEIECIVVEDSHTAWFATSISGVFRIDRKSGTVTRLQVPFHRPSMPFVYIRDLMLDSRRRLWISSDEKGISIYHLDTKQFEHIESEPRNPQGLPSTAMRCMFEDRNGNIWLGSNGKGLHFTSMVAKEFRLLRTGDSPTRSISITSFRCIYQDADSVLWLGGYGGLNRIDRKSGALYVFPTASITRNRGASEKGLQNQNIHSLHPDPTDPSRYLLVGTEGDGLYRVDKNRLTVQRLPVSHDADPLCVRGYTVYDILTDRNGILWIGTDLGLSSYDPRSGKYKHYQHGVQYPSSLNVGGIRCLYEDRHGFLWIGSDRGGVGLFDPVTKDFARFQHDPKDPNSISSNRIYCLHEDRRGMLWIGTALGLNRMDRQNTTFQHFNRSDGFPNDVMYGILEDREGLLWISTNNGIVRFHPYRGVLSTFDISDGLQGNEFNSSAYFQSEDGEMFFGGVNGLTYFDPMKIARNPFIPPVRITGCRVGGHEVIPRRDEHGNLLVELEYSDDAITFEFAALSYYRAEKNRYRYRLEGMNQRWIDAGHNRDITFIALSPGEYLLHIRGSNNDEVWNTEGVTILLRILPPVWGTWWFRLLAIILLLSIVFVIVRWRLMIVRKQELQLVNTVEGRTAELRHSNASLLQEIEERKRAEADAYRANATKSEFLAHLSHEIRTPMNAILGFTEILNDKVTDKQNRKYLRSIELSGNNLLRLINDILDLSKIEAGRLDLQLATVDLRQLLVELEQLFEFQFRKKNLHFELKYDDRIPRTLYLDELRMRQILFNLVGNAVKYTEKGTVTVEAALASRRANNCTVAIVVRDTGMGIPPSQQTAIFEPFRQVGSFRTAEARGTGLGLAITKRLLDIMGGSIDVESKLGQGSVFRVVLPDLRFPDDILFEVTGVPESSISSTAPKPPTEQMTSVRAPAGSVPLTTASREALCTLLKELESRHLQLWQQVSRSYHIQEMEQLAGEVLIAAERAAFLPLIEWSKRLLSEAGDFDMDNVPRTLHQFAEHLQYLRDQCQQA